MPRQAGDDHAVGVRTLAPNNTIAGDECFDIRAQMAALNRAGAFAAENFHIHLAAEMRNDQAGLFGAKFIVARCSLLIIDTRGACALRSANAGGLLLC
jgi:hypothetical protein